MEKKITFREVLICIAFLLFSAPIFSQNNSTNKSTEIFYYKTITENNVNLYTDALNKLLNTLKSEFEKTSPNATAISDISNDIKLIENLISWVNQGNDIAGFPEKNQDGIIILKSVSNIDNTILHNEATFLGDNIIEFPGLIIKRQQKQ